MCTTSAQQDRVCDTYSAAEETAPWGLAGLAIKGSGADAPRRDANATEEARQIHVEGSGG